MIHSNISYECGNLVMFMHLIVFLAGIIIWFRKRLFVNKFSFFWDVVSSVSILISLVVLVWLHLILKPGLGESDLLTWFLEFSASTFGFFPVITMFSFFLSGRLVGKLIYNWKIAKLSQKGFGRQKNQR